jgi:hypothetical protein
VDAELGQESSRFNLRRVPRPEWVSRPLPLDHEAYEDLCGEQLEWGFAIPWTFRALASPATGEPMLVSPSRGDDVYAACAYWTPLVHLLSYSFGWSRPDRGLRWWYDAGKPTDDYRFELIREAWDRDGMLDWFAAFLWSDHWATCNPLAGFSLFADASPLVDVDQQWIEEHLRAADASGIPNPISGGTDPLHLAWHCAGPLALDRDGGRMIRSSRDERHATLILEAMSGWYRTLDKHASDLPDLGQHSWYVDVLSKPVGWLGTFRRSRQTGLWFSGRHRHHVVGT